MFISGKWGYRKSFRPGYSHPATKWLREIPISGTCMTGKRKINSKVVLPENYTSQFHSHFIDKRKSYGHVFFEGAGKCNPTICPEGRWPEFICEQHQ